jgi:hypothetical protein
MPEQQLDGFHGRSLLNQSRRHGAHTTVRRPTPYACIPVQLCDVRLQAIACEVIDWLTRPVHPALRVEMKLVTLMRQDQRACRFKASIASQIVGRAHAPRNPVAQVLIECVSGLYLAQVDAALPARFVIAARRLISSRSAPEGNSMSCTSI